MSHLAGAWEPDDFTGLSMAREARQKVRRVTRSLLPQDECPEAATGCVCVCVFVCTHTGAGLGWTLHTHSPSKPRFGGDIAGPRLCANGEMKARWAESGGLRVALGPESG